MPKQSTRHKYRTRRERNATVARKTKIVLLFAALLAVLLLIRGREDIWLWVKAMTM